MRKYYFTILFLFQQGLMQMQAQQTPTTTAERVTVTHLVMPNETKYGLSKKYNISIAELERQNPHIVPMLKKGDELTIRLSASQEKKVTEISSTKNNSNNSYLTYLVQPKETLYGISRKFKINISELIEVNKAVLGPVLLSGQTLSIPTKNEPQSVIESQGLANHIVQVGETKYGLSKRYGISIKELESRNPHIVDMLRTGQQLTIPGLKSATALATPQNIPVSANPVIVKKEEVSAPKTEVISKKITQDLISYEVKPQETLYGISKMSGLTQDELFALNPELNEGLKAGMIIKIPSNTTIPTTIVSTVSKSSEKGLLGSLIKNQLKEIAFLMPFTEEEFNNYLKSPSKNSETNASLEFYSGALMAMDSLKGRGVLIKSQLIKQSNSNLIEKDFSDLVNYNIQNYKAVFALPNLFYSDQLGTYLAQKDIPFIISNTKSNSTAETTYSSIPSDFQLRKLILDYLVSKNENLIIISDSSRPDTEKYIAQNYPSAKLVKFESDGVFSSESLRKLMSVDQKNYVVFNTSASGLILSTTTLLLKESREYESQIALLEPIETLQDRGLSDMRFRALKMIYPSQYHPSNLKLVSNFKQKFNTKFGFEPSEEAIKGFDVAFDVLTRLFQDKNFETIAKEISTEHIRLKFKYVDNLNQGYFNTSGFILQFDEESNNKIIN